MFSVAGLPSNAGVPGVVGVSAIPYKHAVTGFPGVDGVLAATSIPADPGITILADGFMHSPPPPRHRESSSP